MEDTPDQHGDAAREHALLRALVAGAPIGIAVLDDELRYRLVNDTLAQINGRPAADHVGRHLREVLAELAEDVVPLAEQVLHTGEPLVEAQISGVASPEAGARSWTVTFYPLHADGGVHGVGVIVVDDTDRQIVERDLKEREEQLRLALDAAHMGSWELDIASGELSWGRRLAELHGHTRATAPASWEGFLERVDIADRERVRQAMDALVAGEGAARLGVEFRYHRPDGVVQWVDRRGVVLPGPNGEPLRAVGLGGDVDERKAAEETLRFLAEASEILAGSLDYRETLTQLSNLVVPRLADWCAVHIPTPDGGLETVAVAHADPERVRWARELSARYPTDPDTPTGVPHVIRTGEPELYEEITDEMLARSARDPEHLDLLRELGFSSALVVPLTAHSRTLGAITFVQAESSRRYTRDDLAVAQELARRAALAVDNARLYEAANAQREAAERLRDALDRVLLVAPSLARPTSSPNEVAEIICEAAREVFGCHTASWWEVREDRIVLLARVPHVEPEPVSDVPLDQAPDVRREVVQQRSPSFVADIGDRYEAASAAAYTERTTVRSSLRVPAIGPTGVTDMLALSWPVPVDPPTDETLIVAQRFADQGALALEQARRRAAQREAERLSSALDHLLQTTPQLRAQGSMDEVATTVCEAAVSTFDCDTAALWQAENGGYRLLAHVPDGVEPQGGGAAGRASFPGSGNDLPRPRFVADVAASEESASVGAGVRSLLHLPLLHGEATEGYLTLGWWSPVERPERAWTVIAQRFADQAVLALEEARRRAAQEEAARLHAQLESGLLPTVAVDDDRVEVHTRYKAGEDRMLLGGDFQDALRLPDGRLALLIGDVSGHGPRAAALGATLRAAWRGLVLLGAGTTQLIAPLDAVLTHERDSDEMFATVCVVWLDLVSRQATLASAGHGAPLLLGPDGVRTLAVEHAPPLGTTLRPAWRPTILGLPEGFSLLLYTDGLVEGRAAPGAGERFGLDRLARLIDDVSRTTSGGDLLDTLLERVRAANGGDPADDIAMLLVSERQASAP